MSDPNRNHFIDGATAMVNWWITLGSLGAAIGSAFINPELAPLFMIAAAIASLRRG